MLNTGNKYLKFRVGPYGLLLAIPYIIEISDFRQEQCEDSGNSVTNDRKTIHWQGKNLPCLDMRSALDVASTATQEPTHILVLRSSTTDEPFVTVTVDEVSHIMEIEEAQWYALNGIDPRLDIFFDRACPDKENGRILVCLAPVEQWATTHIEATNAH